VMAMVFQICNCSKAAFGGGSKTSVFGMVSVGPTHVGDDGLTKSDPDAVHVTVSYQAENTIQKVEQEISKMIYDVNYV
jgi:hypothetical protein